ncbi:hypothetical protein LIA77_08656 [Sarocladium implicatum]|nr:hypothetical protein LIA77_08656 [Sarocladium implicatum]
MPPSCASIVVSTCGCEWVSLSTRRGISKPCPGQLLTDSCSEVQPAGSGRIGDEQVQVSSQGIGHSILHSSDDPETMQAPSPEGPLLNLQLPTPLTENRLLWNYSCRHAPACPCAQCRSEHGKGAQSYIPLCVE